MSGLVHCLSLARRLDLNHPDAPVSRWSVIEIAEHVETTGNEAAGDVPVHPDSLAPGRYVDAGDHDAEQRAPSCAQHRFDGLKFGSGVDLTFDPVKTPVAALPRLGGAEKPPAIIRDAKC